tara:strand:- start:1010 stop:1246 length:237 start_codon:yes stop_codon:yes gene_type:complete
MNLLEGMTTIILKKNTSHRETQRELNVLFVLLLLRIISVSIVAYFLWPRIIPQVFTNVNADPGFLNLLGLSLIIGLLL